MPITSIGRDFLNNVSIVGFTTTDTLATVSSVDYIKNQQPIIDALNKGPWTWIDTDTILVNAADGNAFYEFLDSTFSTLLLLTSPTGGIITPGTMGNMAYYPATGNRIAGTNNMPNQVQVPVGSLSHGTNASGLTFWRGDGTWSRTTGATVSSNAVYVSPLGSDTTGNGTIADPYRTIAHALTTITTNNHLNIFNIVCSYGIYNETTLSLKPFVSISGTGSELNVTGDINLDASWATVGTNGGITQVIDFLSLTTTGDVNLDFTPASTNPCKLVMTNIDFTSITNFIITANRNFSCFFDTLRSFSPVLNNVSGTMDSCFAGNMTFNGDSVLSTSNFKISNSDFTGDVSFLGSALAMTSTLRLYSSKINGLLSVDQANISLSIDCDSLLLSSLPTITNGATVTYINVANTLTANYTPVNYTPDATGGTDPSTSVAAHLHGIDDKIGTLSSEGLVWNDVTGVSQLASVNNGYVTDNAGLVTVTLPATAAFGDRVAVQGKGAGGWSLVANTGQTIHVGNVASSVAGSVSSTNQWDGIELLCVTADTTWTARFFGNFTVA